MKKAWSYCGLTNYVNQSSRVLFLDYDNLTLNEVRKQLYFLSSEHSCLGDWAIIKTRPNHFWAINFSVINTSIWKKILKNSGCDIKYIEHSIKFGVSTIRLTKHYNFAKNQFQLIEVLINSDNVMIYSIRQSLSIIMFLFEWFAVDKSFNKIVNHTYRDSSQLRLVWYWREMQDELSRSI